MDQQREIDWNKDYRETKIHGEGRLRLGIKEQRRDPGI